MLTSRLASWRKGAGVRLRGSELVAVGQGSGLGVQRRAGLVAEGVLEPIALDVARRHVLPCKALICSIRVTNTATVVRTLAAQAAATTSGWPICSLRNAVWNRAALTQQSIRPTTGSDTLFS